MFEFTGINSQESSVYLKNQGNGNLSSKPESDFFSMILNHSEISSEQKPVREQIAPEKNHDGYYNKDEIRERPQTVTKKAEEIGNNNREIGNSEAKTAAKEEKKTKEADGKKPEAADKNVKTEEKKLTKEIKTDEHEAGEIILNKISLESIMKILESEKNQLNISKEEMAGIVKSLLSGKEVKAALKSALEEFSLSGNIKDFEKAVSDNLKKIPDRVIEEALKQLNNNKNQKAALNTEELKKILEKALLQHSAEGTREIAALKGKNLRHHHGESGEAKIDNNALNSDKVKIALAEGDDSLNKKSFNDKGESKEGFAFNYNRSDATGKRINDLPEMKGKSPEFKQNLQEIMDRAKISVRDNRNANFNVKLYPRELGNVNVNLSLENGVVIAKFFVDSDEAKNQLSQNMDNLKQQLQDAGIEVGEFNVGVNDHGKSFLNDKDNGGKKSSIQFPEGKELVSAASIYDGNSSVLNSNSINVII